MPQNRQKHGRVISSLKVLGDTAVEAAQDECYLVNVSSPQRGVKTLYKHQLRKTCQIQMTADRHLGMVWRTSS
jgi:hypothetical protein